MENKIPKVSVFFVILLSSLLCGLPRARAVTDQFSLVYYHPQPGNGDFIFSTGSVSLPKGKWLFNSQFDYGYQPLEITQNGTRVGGIMDALFIQHFGASVGITPWWQVDLDIPLVWINKFAEPTASPDPTEIKTDLADIFISQRFSLLNREKKGIGLAFVPFVTIPIGNQGHFVGDPLPTGGGLLVLDGNILPGLSLGLNIGVEGRERVQLFDLDFSSRFIASSGMKVSIMDGLDGKLDLFVATPLSKFFKDQTHTMTELGYSFDYFIGKSGFKATLGGGISLVRGAGVPFVRTLAGLTYQMK